MGAYPLFFFSLHRFYSHHFFAGLLHRWPSQACWLLLASGSLFWPYLPQAKINNPGGNTALPKKHQQVSKKIKPVVGGPASALELAVAGLAACSCFLLFPLGWPAKKKLRRQSGSRNWIHIWYNMMPKQQHCMSRKQCWALHRPCSHWHIGLGWPGRSCLPCSLLVLLLLVVLHPLQVAFLQLAHLALQVLHLFSLLSFFFSFFLSFVAF